MFSAFGLAHAQLHGCTGQLQRGTAASCCLGLWDLGARTRGPRQHPSPRSPFAICDPHSPFRVQDFQGWLRDRLAQATESLAAASHIPPCHWSPPEPPSPSPPPPGPPPARSCSAVGCIALLWVPGTASEGGLHLSGCLSAFPRHRQPALEPLHLCALHLLGTVFLPCLNIDIYLA